VAVGSERQRPGPPSAEGGMTPASHSGRGGGIYRWFTSVDAFPGGVAQQMGVEEGFPGSVKDCIETYC
jgi:hypothetical protein